MKFKKYVTAALGLFLSVGLFGSINQFAFADNAGAGTGLSPGGLVTLPPDFAPNAPGNSQPAQNPAGQQPPLQQSQQPTQPPQQQLPAQQPPPAAAQPAQPQAPTFDPLNTPQLQLPANFDPNKFSQEGAPVQKPQPKQNTANSAANNNQTQKPTQNPGQNVSFNFQRAGQQVSQNIQQQAQNVANTVRGLSGLVLAAAQPSSGYNYALQRLSPKQTRNLYLTAGALLFAGLLLVRSRKSKRSRQDDEMQSAASAIKQLIVE